jgi:hypothetical protein
LTANGVLDLIESSDPPQGLISKRRLGDDMDVVKFASGMRPAERQLRRLVSGGADQASEPGVAVDLKQSAEAFQMTGRMLALAVLAEEVGGGRMAGPGPWAVVGGITPQASGHGTPAAGVEHRQCGIVRNDLRRGQYGAQDQLMQRRQPPAGTADPTA